MSSKTYKPGQYVMSEDANSDLTLWLVTPNLSLIPVLRKDELPPTAVHLWDVILEAVKAEALPPIVEPEVRTLGSALQPPWTPRYPYDNS